MAIGEKDLQQSQEFRDAWRSFRKGKWQREIHMNNFIELNMTPYTGDGCFLANPTEATIELWRQVSELLRQERANGRVLDIV